MPCDLSVKTQIRTKLWWRVFQCPIEWYLCFGVWARWLTPGAATDCFESAVNAGNQIRFLVPGGNWTDWKGILE